jgi:hypothetical protein
MHGNRQDGRRWLVPAFMLLALAGSNIRPLSASGRPRSARHATVATQLVGEDLADDQRDDRTAARTAPANRGPHPLAAAQTEPLGAPASAGAVHRPVIRRQKIPADDSVPPY